MGGHVPVPQALAGTLPGPPGEGISAYGYTCNGEAGEGVLHVESTAGVGLQSRTSTGHSNHLKGAAQVQHIISQGEAVSVCCAVARFTQLV